LLPGVQGAVSRAFRRYHGGSRAIMWRRPKDGQPERLGGMSLSTERPTTGEPVAYEVVARDVLLHHAVEGTPLTSRSFRHEKEVILVPTARPRRVVETGVRGGLA
jgi:hypothetical protein